MDYSDKKFPRVAAIRYSSIMTFLATSALQLFLIYVLIDCYFSYAKLVYGDYPYSSDDLSLRQESILEKLRGDMSLIMNEELVPTELKSPIYGELFMRNLEVCYVL